MQPKVMITDGGPHPADKWAELSVSDILSIQGESETAQAGRKLELKLLDVFEDWYQGVLNDERDQIHTLGDGYLTLPCNGDEHSTDVLIRDVLNAAKGTQFEAHFARPDYAERIKAVVRHHVALLQDVESGWHADASGTPVALQWRQNNTDLGLMRAHEGLSEGVK